MAAASVPKLYQSVIDDVISNVREAFIDEGVDEQILTELKQVWEKKLVESKAIEREPEPSVRNVAQSLSQLQQQSSHVASSATLSHQLTVPAGNIMPQAVLQYTTGGTGDGQKTMALNLPPKLTLTVPAHLAQTGLQTLVSTTPGAAVQLPPELASFFQSNVIHSNTAQHGSHQTLTASQLQQLLGTQPNVPQLQNTKLFHKQNIGGQQISGLQYQTITADQLQKTHFTLAAPTNASQSQNAKIFYNKNIGQQIPGLQYQTVTADQMQKTTTPQYAVTLPANASQSQTSILQLDGRNDTSDEDDEDDFQGDDDDRDDNDEEQNDDDVGEEDEEPLNSDDDVSDDDPADLFDTDNVVVCQYDKIARSKNRWKFNLKDGIMNLHGKDFVFQKALGDSEW